MARLSPAAEPHAQTRTPKASLQQVLKSPLLRSLAAVAGSTAAGQAIALGFSPLITRIYSPEIFGVQGVFLALVSVLWPLAGLRYPMAIVIARDEAEARGLARLSLYLAGGLSCLSGLILLGLREPLSQALGLQDLGLLIYFLPLALFLVTLQDVMDYRAVRLGAFRTVGIVIIAQSFLVNLARVLIGLVQPVAAALVSVTSLSYGMQALMMRAGIKRREDHGPSIDVPEATVPLGQLLRRYQEFPIYRMPADLISAVGQTAPVFLLTILFSPAAAGFYALARGVVNLPLNVIGTAVGNVLYSRMAEMARDRTPLFPFVLRATLWHLLLPGSATAIAILFFPPLFAFAFGEAWRGAGEYAQWMALWVICMLANIPTVRALPVIGQQKLHLTFNFLLMAGGVAGMLVGYALHPTPLWSVAAYSLATTALYALQIVFYLHRVRQYDDRAATHV